MNAKLYHVSLAVAKVAGTIAALSSYESIIPKQYLPIGLLVVAIASATEKAAEAINTFLVPPDPVITPKT